ncbi:alginate lyase family protein [Exiguobacterium sp. SH0S7]|uniref:heparinase II/III family protein n=1 Tax=Exiguobacterium sp. SH0S7 TaxID=2510951 RepID=UPI00103D9025|nr:heparinase II/III family protein [Exiguobacterium sp. SH0S7]TCI71238.1 alginate lyase family protein [Exiguobacterium sp. SH0S7]
MKKLIALVVMSATVVTTVPAHPAEASSTTPFHIRSVPNATVYEMKNNRITPVTAYPVTKRYKVVRPSGWYYIAVDGSKQIMIKKSESKLLLAAPLSGMSMNSTTTRQLAHDYVTATKLHVPYEYEAVSPERAKQYADRALRGDWYIQTAPFRLTVKNVDTFNWSVPASESNSYPFQIHYLTVLNQLTQAYNDTGDLAYLKYGERVIKSWTKAHPVANYKQMRWPYNDHGTSIRTFHLLNFWDVYKKTSLHKDPNFTGLMLKTFHEHGTLLATPSFYKTYHNHGIFQDMALTAIAQTFPEFDKSGAWQTLANTRLQKQITHSISKDAVHLEHSPGYQSYMYHTFARFLDWAEANRFVLPPSMANMEDMPKQLTYMLKPNSTLPIFGDTSGAIRTKGIIPDTDDYPELAYALTRGTEGVKPPHVLKRIGTQYSFMREYWSAPPRAFTQATQVMMTAGYYSSAHKHADDLTIDVYGLGRDFIIETGRYGYTNRPERQRVFGVDAHNTVHRDGENLDLSAAMRGKSRIVTVKNTGPTSLAIGESKLIGKGATHRRTLVYDKAQTLVVYDKITGPASAKYVQRFHLAEGLKLLKSSIATQNVLYGDTNGRTVQLMQLNLNGTSMRTSTSFVAVRDYEWKPRAQVISYNTGKDVRYVTLIRLDQSKTTITKTSVKAIGTNYVVTYTLSNKQTKQIIVPM